MSNRFGSILGVLLLLGTPPAGSYALGADDPPRQADKPPTVEQVNDDPGKFVGRRLVFDDLHVLGEAEPRTNFFRLTVKTPQGTTFTPDHTATQRIVFLTFGKGKQATTLASSLQKGGDSRVRLTCQLERGQINGRFLARLVRLDFIRFGEPEGQALEEITAEQLNQRATKYLGKTLVLNDVTLTGARRDMRARVALELRSPAGTVFETALKGDQLILFTIPTKDKLAKEYVDAGLSGDQARRLRLVVDVLKPSGGVLRADIRRLDAVAYDHDRAQGLNASGSAKPSGKDSQAKTTPRPADTGTDKGEKSLAESRAVRTGEKTVAPLTPVKDCRLLDFKGNKLYYSPAVTEAEGRQLGNFLQRHNFFSDSGLKIEALLDRSGTTYEFRVSGIKEDATKSQPALDAYKVLAKYLSRHVFDGKPVEVHLCVESLHSFNSSKSVRSDD